MSTLTAGACTLLPIMTLCWNDERIRQTPDRWNVWDRSPQLQPWADGLLWSSSRLMAGDSSALSFLIGSDANNVGRWGHVSQLNDESGGQGMRKIRGITRDSSGNPLGSVLVQGFITATDLYVGQCYSDPGGYYELCSPYPGQQHYLVAYLGGSPDVTGATVNTLTPS